MTRTFTRLSRRYAAALRKYLKQRPRASLQPARSLGHKAMALGLETLDLARIHEQALITLVLSSDSPGTRETMVRRAGMFFAEAITPIEMTHRTAREANLHFGQLNQTLRQRSADLVVSNRQLKREVFRRKGVEQSLRKSER